MLLKFMQERYLGDIHDFKKFIFLKFLSIEFNKQIGLNWYLVDPKFISIKEKKNNDGEHRKYIQDEKFKNISSSLVREIAMLGGDISSFVPPSVKLALERKL